MRLPDFHPLTLSLVDTLRLRRRRFYNVDVKERRQDGGVRVEYKSPHDGKLLWTCPHPPVDPAGEAPAAAGRTYIRTNGLQVRRADYAADPKPINAGFGIDQHLTTAKMLDDALESVRDYYSRRGADGARHNFPDRDAWIEGWAKLIFDFDRYSMLRFLREHASLPEGAIHAIGTIENLTSRLPLSFLHSFIGRSIINPGVTYWEIAGGMQQLTDALARDLEQNIVRNARMIELRQREGGVEVLTIPEPDGTAIDVKAKKTKWQGDFAVVTIPFSSLRFVETDPLFSYKKRRAIIELHYDAATKVVLEFRKRWWEWDEKRWIEELEPAEWEKQREWMRQHGGAQQFVGGGSVSDNPNRFMYYPSHPVGDSEGG
jgi:monoamine oxidase